MSEVVETRFDRILWEVPTEDRIALFRMVLAHPEWYEVVREKDDLVITCPNQVNGWAASLQHFDVKMFELIWNTLHADVQATH
jgi:hypothetical protein